MRVEEDPRYTPDYLDPEKRSIANAVQLAFADGSRSPRVAATAPPRTAVEEVRWAAHGRLVFQVSDLFSLRSVGADGRVVKLGTFALTSGMGEAFAVSPDGRRVVFTAPCGCKVAQGTSVHVVPSAGGQAHSLSRHGAATDRYPSFASDNFDVVFSRGSSIVLDSLLQSPTRRVAGRGDWAAYSPDGRWLAYFDRSGLELRSTDGGVAHPLVRFHYVDGTAKLSWSPSSAAVALVSGNALTVVDLAGHRTPVPVPGQRVVPYTAQWSPDGASLAIGAATVGDDLDTRVYVVAADGTGLRRIA
jgi:Tol biopolymer transport system component